MNKGSAVIAEVITVKNCKKHLKRCYTLRDTVDTNLMWALAEFGFLEVNEFSKILPEAKDVFIIRLDDLMGIEGVLGDRLLYLSVSKKNIVFIKEFEGVVNAWGNKITF